ncbi:hypothetical protein GCM10025864_14720 [Luteimicrobium album]|uniref:Uncharacterized protein n=1 Tax=Luteimicrobium album TaxID=1054550 RepID=A0ABQ6HYZ4_9MICO|nr:hypothetical protein GCM10025864_14720 [Luteimicrobium album]
MPDDKDGDSGMPRGGSGGWFSRFSRHNASDSTNREDRAPSDGLATVASHDDGLGASPGDSAVSRETPSDTPTVLMPIVAPPATLTADPPQALEEGGAVEDPEAPHAQARRNDVAEDGDSRPRTRSATPDHDGGPSTSVEAKPVEAAPTDTSDNPQMVVDIDVDASEEPQNPAGEDGSVAGDNSNVPGMLDPVLPLPTAHDTRAELLAAMPEIDDSTPLAAELARDVRRRIELEGRTLARPDRTRVITVANQKGA